MGSEGCNIVSVPTRGETFTKLLEHLRLAQESAAMMGHLENANDQRKIAIMWLQVSELLAKMTHRVTELAKRGLS